jgi:hypothetical protein
VRRAASAGFHHVQIVSDPNPHRIIYVALLLGGVIRDILFAVGVRLAIAGIAVYAYTSCR